MRSVMLAAATMVGGPSLLSAQGAPAESAEAGQPGLVQPEAVLRDRNAPLAKREDAAKRLVSLGKAETNQILLDALNTLNDPAGQQAVARALANSASPDPRFIGPLRNLL